MAKVKISEIISALELQFDDLAYFLNKETGEVVGIQDEEFRAAEEEEPLKKYPEWQRESIVIAGDILFSTGKYAALPNEVRGQRVRHDGEVLPVPGRRKAQ